MSSPNPTHLFFVDVETTGTNEQKDLLLEIAGVVVCAKTLQSRSRWFHRVLSVPLQHEHLDPWIRETHGKNGLLADVADSVHQNPAVDADLRAMLEWWVDDGNPRITVAGASVHFDLRVIRRWLPRTAELLHYRVFDTSSLKTAVRTWLNVDPEVFVKWEAHRAKRDVEEELINARTLLKLASGT